MRLWSDDDFAGMPPGRGRLQAWVELRMMELRSLAGQRILDWQGERLALREVGPDGLPQFHDPRVRFRQFGTFYINTSGDGWVQVLTNQDDHECGLWALKIDVAPTLDLGGIFCPDDLAELPRGRLDRVSFTMGGFGNIAGIEFQIGATSIILMAAEAIETQGGELCCWHGGEDMFLFTSWEDAESVDWMNPE